jgi:hypothetical protein
VLEVRWEAVVVGGVLVALAICLVVQIAFRLNIARALEAWRLAMRDVPAKPNARPSKRDHDGGSPISRDDTPRARVSTRPRTNRHALRWTHDLRRDHTSYRSHIQ